MPLICLSHISWGGSSFSKVIAFDWFFAYMFCHTFQQINSISKWPEPQTMKPKMSQGGELNSEKRGKVWLVCVDKNVDGPLLGLEALSSTFTF